MQHILPVLKTPLMIWEIEKIKPSTLAKQEQRKTSGKNWTHKQSVSSQRKPKPKTQMNPSQQIHLNFISATKSIYGLEPNC